MKLVLKDARRGIIKIVVDDNEDYYYLDKLVNIGDKVKSLTLRKVKKGEKEETVKKKYLITITVEESSFEAEGLRFKGKISATSSDDVPLNSYHSISAERGKKLTILKKKITKTDEEIISKALRVRKKVLLSVVDYGEAYFGLLLKNEVKRLGDYEENIKERDVKKTEENEINFLKDYAKKIEEYDKRENPGLIIIGSIGFVGEHVRKVLAKKILEKTRFCKVSNTTINGLNEIINRGEVDKAILEEEVIKESQLVSEFFARVGKGSAKTVYGFEEVREKTVSGGVDKLLVSDELVKQEKVRELIDMVESLGGETEIISSKHDKGEEFLRFGGVAAFLRY